MNPSPSFSFNLSNLTNSAAAPVSARMLQRHPGPERALQRGEFRVGAYRMKAGRLAEVLIGEKSKGGLRYVGVARPAMASLRGQLFRLLRMLRVHTFCPFVGVQVSSPKQRAPLPEHKVAECQWVEANVKVWVEFEGRNESGHLVNPRVVAMN